MRLFCPPTNCTFPLDVSGHSSILTPPPSPPAPTQGSFCTACQFTGSDTQADRSQPRTVFMKFAEVGGLGLAWGRLHLGHSGPFTEAWLWVHKPSNYDSTFYRSKSAKPKAEGPVPGRIYHSFRQILICLEEANTGLLHGGTTCCQALICSPESPPRTHSVARGQL